MITCSLAKLENRFLSVRAWLLSPSILSTFGEASRQGAGRSAHLCLVNMMSMPVVIYCIMISMCYSINRRLGCTPCDLKKITDFTTSITSGGRFRAVLSSLPLRFLVRYLSGGAAQPVHMRAKSKVVSLPIFGRTNPMFSNKINRCPVGPRQHGQRMAGRQRRDLFHAAVEEGAGPDEDCSNALLRKSCERRDALFVAADAFFFIRALQLVTPPPAGLRSWIGYSERLGPRERQTRQQWVSIPGAIAIVSAAVRPVKRQCRWHSPRAG